MKNVLRASLIVLCVMMLASGVMTSKSQLCSDEKKDKGIYTNELDTLNTADKTKEVEKIDDKSSIKAKKKKGNC